MRRKKFEGLYFGVVKAGNTCDVAIIGGGVIGLACAWRLAQRGAKVHLFERGQVGKEASWAAAGMLAAQVEAAVHPPQNTEKNPTAREAFFDLCLQSRAMYGLFAADLHAVTGHDIELDLHGTHTWLRPLGITYIAKHKDDAAIAAFEAQRERGLSVACIDTSIRQWLPNISDFQRAFYLAEEGAVDNRKLVKSLSEAVARAKVSILENVEVRNVQTDDFGATVRTSGETFNCGKVLMCAGAWSGHIPTPLAQMLLHVQPVGGQMISLKYALNTIIYSCNVYLVPRRDGRLLVGATVEAPGFRHQVRRNATVAGTLQLLQAACELLPDMKGAPMLDSWAGLRPATPDGLPILGSTPMKNLFVATGHFRNGILLAPITAQLMADCILDGKTPPREFSLERFESGVLAS